jgi:hypothetical protein
MSTSFVVQADLSPFSDDWWLWLVFTGWSIGCVLSVKWVGLFATAFVGLYVIEDLWEKFGDLSMPVVRSKLDQSLTVAHLHQPLDCPRCGSHCSPSSHLHGIFQSPLHDP